MQRQEVIQHIVEAILHLPSHSILRIGIDGDAGSGKTTFGDEMEAALRPAERPVIRASVDGFHHPRENRYRRGKDSPDGFFRDLYDYGSLSALLLDPLSLSGWLPESPTAAMWTASRSTFPNTGRKNGPLW